MNQQGNQSLFLVNRCYVSQLFGNFVFARARSSQLVEVAPDFCRRHRYGPLYIKNSLQSRPKLARQAIIFFGP
jgi:hypothetical protein